MLQLKKVRFFDIPEDEIDFDSFTRFSRFVFKLLCLDFDPPRQNINFRQKSENIAKKFCWLFLFLTLVMASILVFANLGISIVSNGFIGSISLVSEFLTSAVTWIKGLVIFLRKDEIRMVFEDLKAIHNRRQNHGQNKNKFYGVKKYLDNLNVYLKMYAIISVLICVPIFFLVFPYIFNGKMGLVINFWFPFDAFTPETYPFYLVFSDLAGYSITNYSMGSDTLLYSLLSALEMEFNVLKQDWITFNYKVKEGRAEKIKELVNRHNALLDIAEKLQHIYTINIFLSFLAISLNLCLISFQLVITKVEGHMILFFVSYLGFTCGQIIFLCIFGQKLIDASESVANGVYFSDWEDFDENDVKKQLLLVICRAQRPKALRALGFAEMSLVTASALRWSQLLYSIICILILDWIINAVILLVIEKFLF